MEIIISLLKVVLVIVCILIVLLVLMQRPKQEGLGAAFAQGMMNEIGGAHTANILQKGTTYLGVIFFGVSLLLSVLISKEVRASKKPYGEVPEGGVAGGAGEVPEPPKTVDTPADGLPDFSTPDLGNIPGQNPPASGGEGTTPGAPEIPETPEVNGDGGGTEVPKSPETPTTPGTPEIPEVNPLTPAPEPGAPAPTDPE